MDTDRRDKVSHSSRVLSNTTHVRLLVHGGERSALGHLTRRIAALAGGGQLIPSERLLEWPGITTRTVLDFSLGRSLLGTLFVLLQAFADTTAKPVYLVMDGRMLRIDPSPPDGPAANHGVVRLPMTEGTAVSVVLSLREDDMVGSGRPHPEGRMEEACRRIEKNSASPLFVLPFFHGFWDRGDDPCRRVDFAVGNRGADAILRLAGELAQLLVQRCIYVRIGDLTSLVGRPLGDGGVS